MQHDFRVFRNILEKNHPSLYWYNSKDSIDYYFNLGYSRLNKPMNEPEFKTILSFVLSEVRCGHTAVRSSKAYSKFLDTVRMDQFPLSIKLWNDSSVIYANLNRKDSILKRGTILDSIDGKAFAYYRDSLFLFLPMDGFSITHKFQTLSNRGGFSSWYRNVFGLKKNFDISYRDSNNVSERVTIPVFNSRQDSVASGLLLDYKKPDRRARKKQLDEEDRSLRIDSSGKYALLVINSFLREAHLSRFIRSSMKTIKKQQIKNLVIDVRYNGGGNVGISNLLTRYLIDHPFKIADSLYAIDRSNNNSRYIQNQFWYWISMQFITRKRSDGKYHFGYFERHFFKPKKHNHYNGEVYVITGGNSFSATSLFAGFLKGQRNVKLVGEETGGGAYGNTAWLIPTATLPGSHVRFTLPRFRLVLDKDAVKDGRGVIPDIIVGASLQSIREATDPKMQKVLELISPR
ncbi:MAG: S41 family peptidase [Chitinophagaceae bacterium]